MSNINVCVVCLSAQVKMYNMDECEKRADFNAVSYLNTYKGNGLPSFLCYQCLALMESFLQFREKCRKTNNILNALRKKNKLRLTLDDINMLDKESLCIKPKLSFLEPIISRCNIYTFTFESPKNDLAPVKVDQDLFICNVGVPRKICNKEANVKQEFNDEIDEMAKNETEDENNYELDDSFNNDFNDNNVEQNNTEHNNIDNNNPPVEGDGTIVGDDFATVVELSELHQKVVTEINIATSAGVHKCNVCNFCCSHKLEYKIHMERHEKHIRGIYCCELCQFYYRTDKLLQAHMKAHHLYKYLCKFCPDVNYSKHKARHHYIYRHLKNKPLMERTRAKKGTKTKSCKKRNEFNSCLPKDYFTITPLSPLEQYELVNNRKLSKNYRNCQHKCELCFKGFNNIDTLTNHQKRHDPSFAGPLQCDICRLMFPDTKRMHKHMTGTHMFKYSCRLCTFMCNRINRAARHYKWHNNVTYPCPECDMVFTRSESRGTHLREKHATTWACTMCGNSYNSETGLHVHKMITHGKQAVEEHKQKITNDPELDLYCAVCELQFGSDEAYNMHLTTSNKHVALSVRKRKRRKDPVPKLDITQRKRKRHEEIYNNGTSNPTTCDECGIMLPNDAQTRIHYKTHHPGATYLKRYMCDVCGYATQQYMNLRTHMRIHTQERPFECEYCDKTFYSSGNRDRHYLVHSGEKNFQCEYCLKCFSQNSIRKLHIQTVHYKIPYPPWINRNRKPKPQNHYENIESEVIVDDKDTYLNAFLSYSEQH